MKKIEYQHPHSDVFSVKVESYVCNASYNDNVTIGDETDDDALVW